MEDENKEKLGLISQENNSDKELAKSSHETETDNNIEKSIKAQNESFSHNPAPDIAVGAPNKPKGLKRKILAISIGIVLFVSAGAAAFYLNEVNKPENRIKMAFSELLGAENISANVGLTSDDFSGNADITLQTVPEDALAANFSFDYEGDKINVELRFIANVIYFKLDSIPSQANQFLPIEGGTLDSLTNSWIKFDPNSLSELGAGEVDTDQLSSERITDADREKIRDIIKDAKLFDIDREIDAKEIDGAVVEGFAISPNPEGIVDALEQIKQANLDVLSDNEEDLNEAIAELKSDIEDGSVAEDEFELVVWLNGDSLRQIELRFDEDGLDLTLTILGFDETVDEIVQPEQSEDLIDLIQELYLQSFDDYEYSNRIEFEVSNDDFEIQ